MYVNIYMTMVMRAMCLCLWRCGPGLFHFGDGSCGLGGWCWDEAGFFCVYFFTVQVHGMVFPMCISMSVSLTKSKSNKPKRMVYVSLELDAAGGSLQSGISLCSQQSAITEDRTCAILYANGLLTRQMHERDTVPLVMGAVTPPCLEVPMLLLLSAFFHTAVSSSYVRRTSVL